MAFTDIEEEKYKKLLTDFIESRRPPVEIRDKVDLGFRIKDYSVEIFEIRSHWQNPEIKIEEAVAKTTFVRSRDIWKVFWMRSDLKWHVYQPKPEVRTLTKFLDLVNEDTCGCFWG
jgi:hypothetical protein